MTAAQKTAPAQKSSRASPKSAAKSAAGASPVLGKTKGSRAKPIDAAKPAPQSNAKSTPAPAQKAAAQVAANPRVAVQAAPTSASQAPAEPGARKAKKSKLVRDSYTIPKPEYQALAALKERLSTLSRPTKKSELLRAGILHLSRLADSALLSAVAQIPALKTGRPKKGART